MDNTSLITSLKRELEMQTDNYASTVRRGMDLLKNGASRKASTHLGHNLANVATDLAAWAGKIEQTENMIRWAGETK